MSKRDFIVAIDGYSSTGKSSFARAISKIFPLIYIDTGALYRGVTLAALKKGVIDSLLQEDSATIEELLNTIDIEFKSVGAKGESELHLNGESVESEIRSLKIAEYVSRVAQIKRVRNFVDNILHRYAKVGGIVMEGRDIGTVVIPDADLKIFMTASPQIRAERRFREMVAKGEKGDLNEVLTNIIERDRLDESRATAPLKMAPDAVLLDNSEMSEKDQIEWIKKIIAERWDYIPK